MHKDPHDLQRCWSISSAVNKRGFFGAVGEKKQAVLLVRVCGMKSNPWVPFVILWLGGFTWEDYWMLQCSSSSTVLHNSMDTRAFTWKVLLFSQPYRPSAMTSLKKIGYNLKRETSKWRKSASDLLSPPTSWSSILPCSQPSFCFWYNSNFSWPCL